MGKNSRGEKEYTRLQETIHENKRLKREVASLRKQLARLDLDRHSYLRDIVDEHLSNERQEETAGNMLTRLKETWRCNKCNTGFLEIILYTKINETWYFRKCNNYTCSHRTKSQKYNPEKVEGPLKNTVK